MNQPVADNPAEIYEQRFVPALFQPWAERIACRAAIMPGHSVLDVACGTGVLACAARQLSGDSGAVTGLDINEQMLAVARRKSTCIDWRQGDAEELPFADASFDAVISQFGFMFFEDKARALRQMWRVLRPNGKMVVGVCSAIDHSPGYAVLAELLQRLFGVEIADAFRAPFSCGDRHALRIICEAAGLSQARVNRCEGQVRFPSIDALVSAERACAWTLGGLLDDAQFERLLIEATESLQPFVDADGMVNFSMPASLIEIEKSDAE